MNFENKNTQNSPSAERNQDKQLASGKLRKAIAGSVLAGLIGAGAAFGIDKAFTENNPSDTEATIHYVEVDNVSPDIQKALTDIQNSNIQGTTTVAENSPKVPLSQTSKQAFVIVDGGGGLAAQAEHAYLIEHNVTTAPVSVQDSITVTTKSLSEINHRNGMSDVIHPNDTYSLIELKDEQGTDYVVVVPTVVDTN